MKRPPCPESRARLVDSLMESYIHCSFVLATKNYGGIVNRHPYPVFVSHLWPIGLNVLGCYQSRPLRRYPPACGHKGSSHLPQVFALCFIYRDSSSALLQLVNQWLNFTYSCCHAFSATETKIQILFFTTIELTTSALVGVRGHLLDHSGVEHLSHVNPARGHKDTRRSTGHIMVTVRCSNQQESNRDNILARSNHPNILETYPRQEDTFWTHYRTSTV